MPIRAPVLSVHLPVSLPTELCPWSSEAPGAETLVLRAALSVLSWYPDRSHHTSSLHPCLFPGFQASPAHLSLRLAGAQKAHSRQRAEAQGRDTTEPQPSLLSGLGLGLGQEVALQICVSQQQGEYPFVSGGGWLSSVMGGWRLLVLSPGAPCRDVLSDCRRPCGCPPMSPGHWPSHTKEGCPLRTPATLLPVPSIRDVQQHSLTKHSIPYTPGAVPGTGPSSEGTGKALLGERTFHTRDGE